MKKLSFKDQYFPYNTYEYDFAIAHPRLADVINLKAYREKIKKVMDRARQRGGPSLNVNENYFTLSSYTPLRPYVQQATIELVSRELRALRRVVKAQMAYAERQTTGTPERVPLFRLIDERMVPGRKGDKPQTSSAEASGSAEASEEHSD